MYSKNELLEVARELNQRLKVNNISDIVNGLEFIVDFENKTLEEIKEMDSNELIGYIYG